MSLVYSQEDRLLRDTAARYLTTASPVESLRKLRDERNIDGFDRTLWLRMAELGWTSVMLPAEYGGLDFSYRGLGAIFEETGRNLTASPLFSTIVLGASVLMLAGNKAQKSGNLPLIAAGELTLALALEEGGHHSPFTIVLRAEKTADGFTLNGQKTFVIDGHSADKLIVVARTNGDDSSEQGISLFLVAADTPGIRRNRTIMVDSRNAANIHFDNVKVGGNALLGEIDQGSIALDMTLDRGRIFLSAEMLGSAEECFKRTIDYLSEREQFGARIGSFQALQHRAAIMYTELQLARSVVMDAFSAIDENRQDLARAASLAKAIINDTFNLVVNEAVQMHGGIGVTDELEIGLFLKRARVAIQILGDAGFHRNRYAKLDGM